MSDEFFPNPKEAAARFKAEADKLKAELDDYHKVNHIKCTCGKSTSMVDFDCQIHGIPADVPRPPRVERDNWANRASMMRCFTCMWFVQKDPCHIDQPALGRCRRRAPTLSGWPAVYGNDWCGDHKLDGSRI